jgi:hypothetical protein
MMRVMKRRNMTRTAIGPAVLSLFFAGIVSASDAGEDEGSADTDDGPIATVSDPAAECPPQASAPEETAESGSWTPPSRPAPRSIVSTATRGGGGRMLPPPEAP